MKMTPQSAIIMLRVGSGVGRGWQKINLPLRHFLHDVASSKDSTKACVALENMDLTNIINRGFGIVSTKWMHFHTSHPKQCPYEGCTSSPFPFTKGRSNIV